MELVVDTCRNSPGEVLLGLLWHSYGQIPQLGIISNIAQSKEGVNTENSLKLA